MVWVEPAREAKFLFEIKGVDQELQVLSFRAWEAISRPFRVNVVLVSYDEIELEQVVGKEALLTIIGNEEDRYFHGVIASFSQIDVKEDYILYGAKVVPALWFLSLEKDCRIFQKTESNSNTVKDVVKTVLEEGGIPSDRFDFGGVKENYKSREYCVQYRETDLHFISRLLEEEGIFYFFEHSEDKHVLKFGDKNSVFPNIAGNSTVIFHDKDDLVPEREYVREFTFMCQARPNKVTLKDYNFRRPDLDLKAEEKASSSRQREIYDYPGKYEEQGRGRRFAKIRLEEERVFQKVGNGKSYCPRFTAGYLFALDGHYRKEFDAEYLLTEVYHEGYQPQVLEELAETEEEEFTYFNRFRCIPSDVPFRPKRITPKPVVHGVQTATVVGPEGEDIYTDDEPYGMIKVQFHWDRKGKRNERSSCWLRVAYPYAGEKHGMQFTPLIGDEVLVEFLEGDPDRPVVTGSLFKGQHKAIIEEDKQIKNKILTPYQHQLLFDDKGAEIVMNTGAGHKLTMSDADKKIEVDTKDGHKLLMSDGDKKILVNTKEGHSFNMSDAEKLVVIRTKDGYLLALSDANEMFTIETKSGHAMRMADFDGSISFLTIAGHLIEMRDDVGISLILSTNDTQIKLNNSGVIEIESSNQITLKADNVTVNAKKVKVEASGQVNVKGGTIKLNSP